MKQITIIGLAAVLLTGSALAVNPTNMIFIEGGTFTMGDTWGDGSVNERPVHQVTVSSFEMSQYEISKQEMARVMSWAIENRQVEVNDKVVKYLDGAEPKLFHRSQLKWDEQENLFLSADGQPFCAVWHAAAVYCNARSEMEGLEPCYRMRQKGPWKCDFQKNGYRLPTEAEWEFAARGGRNSSQTRYSGGDTLDEVAWFHDNTGKMEIFRRRVTIPGTPGYDFSTFGGPSQSGTPNRQETRSEQVETHRSRRTGSKKANDLGLYDMSGNEREWCFDWYGEYHSGSQTNPVCLKPPKDEHESHRVVRGGGSGDQAEVCRVSARLKGHPEEDRAGFRVVRSVLPRNDAE